MMANKHPYKQIPVKDREGGWPAYLDLPEQKKKHHGLGWADLKQRRELGVPTARIAREFNVSINTVNSWVE